MTFEWIRNNRIVWAYVPVLLSLLMVVLVANQYPFIESIRWRNVFLEGFLGIASVFWCVTVCLVYLPRISFYLLFTGFSFLYLGLTLDVLNEFVNTKPTFLTLFQIGFLMLGAIVGSFGVWSLAKAYGEVIKSTREKSEEYFHLSITDNLTGLFNNRYFRSNIEKLVPECQRNEVPLSLLILDIDNFKQYNDAWGHLAGDEVLSAFGRKLRSLIRTSDMGFRYGGEELAVLFHSADKSQALRVSERIRMELALLQFSPASGQMVRITASCGLAELRPDDTVTSFIARADKRLYQAKSEGKDQTVIDD